MSLDDPDVNWKVDEVLDHLVKEHGGRQQVFFKVKWLEGDTSYVHMDDL